MKPAPAIFALTFLFASGCAHRPPAMPCAQAELPAAARAMPAILALQDPAPAMLEAGFVLCSPHRGRLRAASEALGAQGYSSYIGAGEGEQCLRVARTHEASATALEREMGTMCRIAQTHRIAYRHWQAEVGGKAVKLAGGVLTVDGEAVR